jgi:hypothetical protein
MHLKEICSSCVKAYNMKYYSLFQLLMQQKQVGFYYIARQIRVSSLALAEYQLGI